MNKLLSILLLVAAVVLIGGAAFIIYFFVFKKKPCVPACKSGLAKCVKGKCECLPNCVGKPCGQDDGCGKACPASCNSPNHCTEQGACEPCSNMDQPCDKTEDCCATGLGCNTNTGKCACMGQVDHEQCKCNAGHAGPRCEFSDETTCNNQGKVNFYGNCQCNSAYVNFKTQCDVQALDQCWGAYCNSALGHGLTHSVNCSDELPLEITQKDVIYKLSHKDYTKALVDEWITSGCVPSCSDKVACKNQAVCDTSTHKCVCEPGYIGPFCGNVKALCFERSYSVVQAGTPDDEIQLDLKLNVVLSSNSQCVMDVKQGTESAGTVTVYNDPTKLATWTKAVVNWGSGKVDMGSATTLKENSAPVVWSFPKVSDVDWF
jgi:hypothetical protein